MVRGGPTMVEAVDEPAEPDLVLAVPPPVPRRGFGAPASAIEPQRQALAPPPVPPPVPPVAPAADDPAPPTPDVAVADDPVPPGRWPDRDWWVSTGTSLCVHVVVLTLLALLVTVSEIDAIRQPIEIVNAAADVDDGSFEDPEELAVQVLEAVAEQPVEAPVEVVAVSDAADAAADAAAAGEAVDVGLVEVDVAGLMDRVGGAAGTGDGLGGFGGEVGRRLARAGAKTGDIQVSLSWNNFNDLDVHVIAPSGERIFFAHRRSRCNGALDVDMNASGAVTREGVENVFWPKKSAPRGTYRVFVHHFARHDAADETAFDVHVLVNGTRRRYSGYVKSGDPPVPVAEFERGGDAADADDDFVE